MDTYEAIESRRSIRKYKAPATEEQLNRIVGAAALAPSPFNRQGWDIVIVDHPELIEKISQIKYRLNRALLKNQDLTQDSEKMPEEERMSKIEEHAQRQKRGFANASLLMVYQRVSRIQRELYFDAGSAWMFIQNICLAAVAEGLGARVVTFWNEAESEVNQLLGAPEGKKLVAGINLGIPDEEPGPRKLKPQEKWVHRNFF
jgi:nitroreductase